MKGKLEEAAERHRYGNTYQNFIRGAQWQKEQDDMYSEDEVRQLLEYAIHESRMQDDKTEDYILKDALEQFKKK